MIDKNFDKGCVFIVGGSGGIGSICAKEFAKAGANVVITYYKNKKAAEDVASDINKNIQIFQLDNKDFKSVDNVMKQAISEYDSINTIEFQNYFVILPSY